MKILSVCLGNICRSPMAEGIIRDNLREAGIDTDTDSAGTAAYHVGELPDNRAISCMQENGHDITDLRARQFVQSDFDNFDLIFAMDDSNQDNILRLARNQADKDKVSLFLNLAAPNQNQEVPDPYYGGDSGFQHVYELLTEATKGLINKLNG